MWGDVGRCGERVGSLANPISLKGPHLGARTSTMSANPRFDAQRSGVIPSSSVIWSNSSTAEISLISSNISCKVPTRWPRCTASHTTARRCASTCARIPAHVRNARFGAAFSRARAAYSNRCTCCACMLNRSITLSMLRIT